VVNKLVQNLGMDTLDTDEKIYDLHPSQENIHFEQILNPDNPFLNLAWRQQFESDIDINVFYRAWQLLYAHIDILRIKFIHDQESLPQQYFNDRTFPIDSV
jgi:hypothetical protein